MDLGFSKCILADHSVVIMPQSVGGTWASASVWHQGSRYYVAMVKRLQGVSPNLIII